MPSWSVLRKLSSWGMRRWARVHWGETWYFLEVFHTSVYRGKAFIILPETHSGLNASLGSNPSYFTFWFPSQCSSQRPNDPLSSHLSFSPTYQFQNHLCDSTFIKECLREAGSWWGGGRSASQTEQNSLPSEYHSSNSVTVIQYSQVSGDTSLTSLYRLLLRSLSHLRIAAP